MINEKQFLRNTLLYLSLKYHGDYFSILNALKNKEDVDYDTVMKTADRFNGHFITYLDDEYPSNLRNYFRPPFVLFYEGDINLLKHKNIVAISCTRDTDKNDYENANIILKNDLDVVYLIVSLKNEMDTYILSLGKPTIAMLGHSLLLKPDNIKCDLVLTECTPDNLDITQETMMRRIGIMAGLATKQLVLSCKNNSGSVFLVENMLNLGKDVLVVPKINMFNAELIGEGAIPCTRALQLQTI